MSFSQPWVLLLLALPVVLSVWEWQRRGHPLLVPRDHLAVEDRGILRRTVQSANLIPHLLLGVIILILAGPQRLEVPKQERTLTNIEICLDISGSMTAPFGDGSRYDAAMAAVSEFTLSREGDAFGLTIFGNEVLHWTPLTRDLSAIRLSTPFLRPERMPPWFGGTQIGKALRSCQGMLTSRPDGDRMIILVSDGMSSDLYGSQAQEIGLALAADQVVLYAIHVGDGPVPEPIYTLAGATGGEVFAAGDPAALKGIFKRIDEMQPARLKPGAPQPVESYRSFALAGLGLLGLGAGCAFGLRYNPW